MIETAGADDAAVSGRAPVHTEDLRSSSWESRDW